MVLDEVKAIRQLSAPDSWRILDAGLPLDCETAQLLLMQDPTIYKSCCKRTLLPVFLCAQPG
jgi:hypothetical protein